MELLYGLVFKAWSWVPWILGLGTIGWLALALLAPGVLSVVSPFLRLAVDAVVGAVRALWDGVLDIIDSWKTIFAVCVIVWAALNYVTFKEAHRPVRFVPHYNQSETYEAPTWKKSWNNFQKKATKKNAKPQQEDLGAGWGWAKE